MAMTSIHKKVQTDIIEPLADYVDLNVTKTNSSADRPPHPFLAYNITSPHIPQEVIHSYTQEVIDSKEEGFDKDIKRTTITQPTLVLSINSHAKEDADTTQTEKGNMVMKLDEEAYDNALKAWEYFEVAGRYDLRAKGFVVVEVGSIEERDVFKEVNYERRKGFDVTLRYLHEVEIILPTIETVEMEINEQEKEFNL